MLNTIIFCSTIFVNYYISINISYQYILELHKLDITKLYNIYNYVILKINKYI